MTKTSIIIFAVFSGTFFFCGNSFAQNAQTPNTSQHTTAIKTDSVISEKNIPVEQYHRDDLNGPCCLVVPYILSGDSILIPEEEKQKDKSVNSNNPKK